MALSKILPASQEQYAGARNLIINGSQAVAQRSTSATGLTSTGYHSIDRFRTSLFNGGTWTQSQSTTVPSGEGFGYSLKMDCTTADTSLLANHHCILQHHIEGQDLQQLKYGALSAESITLSFWVRSSKTGTYTVEFEQLGNTKQYSQTYSISTANTWQKVTLTIDGDTASSLANDNSCELRVNWYLAAGPDYTSGTFNNSAWATTTTGNRVSSSQVNLADSTSNDWYITGVQLEVGEATPFEHRSYGDELRRCQRFYGKYYLHKGSEYMTHGGNISLSSNFSFPTTMRATPSSSHVQNINASNCNSSSITFVDVDGASYQVNMHVTSGTVSRRDIYAFDAEL
jgi:hypothetical protein